MGGGVGRRRGGRSASGSKRPRRVVEEEEGDDDSGEGLCFVCKDGGDLRLCDFRGCHKAYHAACVGKDSDFLTSDEDFICEWHTCFICKGRSSYFCFCCAKHSFCKGCVIKVEAEFVPVLTKTKGFCSNCLRMAIMIERNVDVDSDGERIDFSDRATLEFLFKDYWEIVKDKEGLTQGELDEAYAYLKRVQNCKQTDGADPGKIIDEEHNLDDDVMACSDDKPSSKFVLTEAPRKIKSFPKKVKSKKNAYVGWGSARLIEFLSSIGKDTSNSLDQFGASDVIKEYIRQKNLLQRDKKWLVICDEKLQSLFRRSKLKYKKIYGLLKKHITINVMSEDETLDTSSDQSASVMAKKVHTVCYDSSTPMYSSEINKRKCFASLVRDNIKLIYLRKSLVVDLLTKPDTFENKVIGCFVRVKNDRYDYHYYMHEKLYQLGQVTGTSKSSEEYKIRDGISTCILLCVSGICDDIRISMLCDDDFKEEECEDLCLLARKGSIKRLTVAELEDKARSLHRDIMSHWINREQQRLEKLIDRAIDNKWENEKIEYIRKQELLHNPSEVQRLLEEVPQVIPETEDNNDTKFLDAEARDTCDVSLDGKQDAEGTKAQTAGNSNTPGMAVQQHGAQASDGATTTQVITIDEDDKDDHLPHVRGGQTEVIDLEADDVADTHPVQHETDDCSCGWYYIDPQGNEQGAVTVEELRDWWDDGYFPEDFKVWRTGQTSDSSVLLRDVLHVTG